MTKAEEKENTAEQKTKKNHFYSFKRIVRMIIIIFLSIACIGASILIYHLHHQTKSTPAWNKPQIMIAKPARKSVNSTLQEHIKEDKTLEKDDSSPIKEQPGSDKSVLGNEKTAEKNNEQQPFSSESENINKIEAEAVFPTEPHQNQEKAPHSLKELITLRDHLMSGMACNTDIALLLDKQQTPQLLRLISKITPICSENTLFTSDIRSIFSNNKKRAMLAYYLEHNPWWLAYPKALIGSIVEVRKLSPVRKTPTDLISMAQNELYKGHIENTSKYINQLPDYMKISFGPFLKKVTVYTDSLAEIDQLILSFETKGEIR